MTNLWLPPTAKTLPRAGVPEGDVKLKDGRVLVFLSKWEPNEWCKGAVFAERKKGGLRVIASIDDHEEYGKLLHVSISRPARDPSWVDIRTVRDAFYPATVDVMMMLPRAADYVNVHEHCFHLWQTPQGWGMR